MNAYGNFTEFDRARWAALRSRTPLLLSEQELENIKGLNDKISLREVEDIYIPLTRLINLKVRAAQYLREVTGAFLGCEPVNQPFIIGIAGSVAVGKSTVARLLKTLLSRWEHHPKVDLVTTDGFLYPTAVLEEKGLMARKGFPESYDTKQLIDFLSSVRDGERNVKAPLYSHITYDILPDEYEVIDQPDILIVEGINVLQVSKRQPVFVSDYFDFSLYIDADTDDIRSWYIDRFLLLQQTAFREPLSYFHRFADLTRSEAVDRASQIWESINLLNLNDNILPTRQRADLILKKGRDHIIHEVYLREI
ncbi:type I pantothenate kinase [Saccharibacillus sp. JS10]|uniref:type I pantothenate kinase n=1 Tax=Saccharibacillus sp. JS10 TaxID=2950552 RepID=UPI00210DE1A8|nr:type I pantothenate kinase [Saccharibacillus sp. JS10]MCQ4085617.1 type I pantothenate kinase [Saccharibacillus sp. JS10]